jgi:hypothetical protein
MLTIPYRRPETVSKTNLVHYYSGKFEMSIHGAWEDLLQNMMGYCCDNANMEADGGKVSKECL